MLPVFVSLVLHLLAATGQIAPPVSPTTLFSFLDVTLWLDERLEVDGGLPKDFDGVTMSRGNVHLVRINAINQRNGKPAPTRARYTMAHEIGHLMLHTNQDFICLTDRGHDDDWEREANSFAAELLMPTSWMREAVQHHSFHEIRKMFGVSRRSLHWRLKELGLLNAEGRLAPPFPASRPSDCFLVCPSSRRFPQR